MLEIASKKLGLEKAILSNMNSNELIKFFLILIEAELKEKSMGLDEQEIELLLKFGAYKIFSDTSDTSDKV